MQRCTFLRNGLKLSYLDSGGNGQPLIALHGHWMEARTFIPLANTLASSWRVIALDQRGHGESQKAKSYRRQDYLDDLESLYGHLGLRQSVLLGHSMGGVNAYQFAARYTGKVTALVIEDIGPTVNADMDFVRSWAGSFGRRTDLEEHIGPKLLPYVRDSFRHGSRGWYLAFDPADMILSQDCLNGNHWKAWLASACDALVIRGEQSNLTTAAELQEMVRRRPHTEFVTLRGGHVVHQDNPDEYAQVVANFLGGA